MLGRPANWAPVWKKVMAGSWLIASVCMVRMKHNSSATLAVWDMISLTQAPDWPFCLNLKIEGAMGRLSWVAVIPVSRWPLRTESGSCWARRSSSPGLWSNRSI